MNQDFLARLPLSPDVYVHKVDLVRDTALLIQLDANGYRRASFLDDRVLTPTTAGAWAPLQRVLDSAAHVQGARPVHFIFHAGHVGSTLLSRLLDETGAVLSLREPLPLRTLADAHDVVGHAESLLSEAGFDALVRALLAIWSRGYADTRAVIVKATSSVARSAPDIVSRAPQSRVIHLNVSAEVYLATLLAGRNSPADLRGHGAVRVRQLEKRLGASVQPLHSLSLGELTAMSWLVETWNAVDIKAAAGERFLSIDFDSFLSRVGDAMQEVLMHLALPCDPAFLENVSHNPVLRRYSKAAEFEYSPETRAEILAESRRLNGEEIRRGLRWLERLASGAPAVGELLHGSRAAAGS